MSNRELFKLFRESGEPNFMIFLESRIDFDEYEIEINEEPLVDILTNRYFEGR